MSDRLKSVAFAAVLCLVCSILLTAASSGLRRFQQENIRLDRQINILKSVGLIHGQKKYSSAEINQLFKENISLFTVDKSGKLIAGGNEKANTGELPLYLYMKTNRFVEAYVIPIDTNGLWGKIYGYLAIKNDGSTIAGFTVYKHSETPGLGGEIEQNWFQDNFVGKKIVDQEGRFVSIAIAKGAVRDGISKERQPNYVDGISGATLTGKFLTSGLKNILSAYEPVSVELRNKRQYCQTNSTVPWCRYEDTKK